MDVRSPIDLSNVPSPQLASFDKKNGGLMNMITMSFGYAIQISPLQTLALYNAIANDGTMMKPYLVNSIQQNGIMMRQFSPSAMEEKICGSSIIEAAKQSMEMVITEGTGKPAFKDMPFAVAGKTGTAHVADGSIKYYDMVYQASFVGYFPANDPQYSCIVVIRTKPHAALHYGGQLSAPVFREIATKLYVNYVQKKNPAFYAGKKDSSAYFYAGNANDIRKVYKTMNVSFIDSVQQADWSNVYADNYQPVITVNKIKPQQMPNVKGMGLKDALYLLENMGLKVAVKGKGKIVTQSIIPGTNLAKGLTVMLELADKS
jgi:cell division protein FtsI (penicillin-binding protein 3)